MWKNLIAQSVVELCLLVLMWSAVCVHTVNLDKPTWFACTFADSEEPGRGGQMFQVVPIEMSTHGKANE